MSEIRANQQRGLAILTQVLKSLNHMVHCDDICGS
jgi:hypothetical protein